MWAGVARVVIDLYGNDDLRLKKRQLDSLCKEVKRKFNLSALEVADQDEPEKCTIGLTAAMPSTWKENSARSFMSKVLKYIDENAFSRVVSEDVDVFFYEKRD